MNVVMSEKQVMELLEIQLAHDRAIDDKFELRERLELPCDLTVNLLDVIADCCGVPKDNTIETNASNIAMSTGVYPEGVYCRDWLLNEFRDVTEGKSTLESFVDSLRSESSTCET